MSFGVQQLLKGSTMRQTSCLTWVLLLSTLGWLLGWVPAWSADISRLTWSTVASAQPVKVDTRKLNNYIDALVEIEQVRDRIFPNVVDFYRQDQKPVPQNPCRQNSLPILVQTSCKTYFEDAASIVKQHRLTIEEFNQMRERAREDATFGALVHQKFCDRLPETKICR